MGCGCGKNKPKVNQGPPRDPSITSQSTTQYNLRINNVPRANPNIQAQQVSPVNPVNPNIQAQQVNNAVNADVSPAGMDAQARRVAQLRRNAIRRALGK